MFVRMSYWKCLPSYWGEDIKLFETGAVKIMQRHDGFVRAMLLAIPGQTQRIAFTTQIDRRGQKCHKWRGKPVSSKQKLERLSGTCTGSGQEVTASEYVYQGFDK